MYSKDTGRFGGVFIILHETHQASHVVDYRIFAENQPAAGQVSETLFPCVSESMHFEQISLLDAIVYKN